MAPFCVYSFAQAKIFRGVRASGVRAFAAKLDSEYGGTKDHCIQLIIGHLDRLSSDGVNELAQSLDLVLPTLDEVSPQSDVASVREESSVQEEEDIDQAMDVAEREEKELKTQLLMIKKRKHLEQLQQQNKMMRLSISRSPAQTPSTLPDEGEHQTLVAATSFSPTDTGIVDSMLLAPLASKSVASASTTSAALCPHMARLRRSMQHEIPPPIRHGDHELWKDLACAKEYTQKGAM